MLHLVESSAQIVPLQNMEEKYGELSQGKNIFFILQKKCLRLKQIVKIFSWEKLPDPSE